MSDVTFQRHLVDGLGLWDCRHAGEGPLHMAIDETLVRLAPFPVLRLYRWSAPAISFGYPQRWSDVEPHLAGRAAIRRWTGGGLVEHGRDLTIALAVPPFSAPSRLSSMEIYDRIHRAAAQALAPHFPDVRLAGDDDAKSGLACFESPARGDVLAGSSKILGGALRRSRSAFLYQGCLQTGCLQTPTIPPAFGADLAAGLAASVHVWQPTTPMWEFAQDLVNSRYSTAAWNHRR